MRMTIDDIFDLTPPKIIRRGREYYENGMVYQLHRQGSHYTALVEGQCEDHYEVEIELAADGEVGYCCCDCPYDESEFCKHIIAVLLAIEAGDAEEAEEEPDLQELVEQADRKKLEALICRWAQRDGRFRLEALSALDTSLSRERHRLEEHIRETIQKNSRWGDLDEAGCDEVCSELIEAAEKAAGWAAAGQTAEAVELICWLMEVGWQALTEGDGSYIPCDLVGELEQCLEHAVDGDRQPCFLTIWEILHTLDFGGWEECRCDLIACAAQMADGEDLARLYALLDELELQAERSGNTRMQNAGVMAQYQVMRMAEHPEKAERYLYAHLEVDELRELALARAMSGKDYAQAEELCLEKSMEEHPWANRWDLALYEIYRQWGKRDRQLLQAKRIWLMGKMEFYQIVKDLLVEDGRWEEEYPALRQQAACVLPAASYGKLLADEGDHEALIELVRREPELVWEFGRRLIPVYGGEVYALCKGVLQSHAGRANKRADYRRLCQQSDRLAEMGGEREAAVLLDEWTAQYPRRRAFLDEIETLRARWEQR